MALNEVNLIGHVGKDPEIRSTQSGRPVASFRLATSEKWRDKNTGETQERTEWHSIVIWNESLVRVVEKYVHKGSQLFVRGQLQTRKWQDQSGQDRYSTEVVLQGFNAQLQMLGKPNGNGRPPGPDDEHAPPADRPERNYDDEIPF